MSSPNSASEPLKLVQGRKRLHAYSGGAYIILDSDRSLIEVSLTYEDARPESLGGATAQQEVAEVDLLEERVFVCNLNGPVQDLYVDLPRGPGRYWLKVDVDAAGDDLVGAEKHEKVFFTIWPAASDDTLLASFGESTRDHADEPLEQGNSDALAGLAVFARSVSPPELSAELTVLIVQRDIRAVPSVVFPAIADLRTLMGHGGITTSSAIESHVDAHTDFIWTGTIMGEQRDERMSFSLLMRPSGQPYLNAGFGFPPMPADRWHAPHLPIIVDITVAPEVSEVGTRVRVSNERVPNDWTGPLGAAWSHYLAILAARVE